MLPTPLSHLFFFAWGALLGSVGAGKGSLLPAAYGPLCLQVRPLEELVAGGPHKLNSGSAEHLQVATAALKTLASDVEAGLIGDLRAKVAGDVLADFIGLARAALDSDASGSVNVAAVLVAAAFEDTIRRMGERFAGVVGRPDLSDVLSKLKESGTIEGAQVGIAQSYLSFRNRALHAEWDKIDHASVQSCLAFVEALLSKHFSGG